MEAPDRLFFSRPRVIWATESAGPHDRRFIQALVDGGWSVAFLSTSGTVEDLQLERYHRPFVAACEWDTPDGAFRVIESRLNDVIARYKPELIWAGPLGTLAHDLAATNSLPLVAMSWGYDLLLDAVSDPGLAAVITSTIKRASRVHVDCDAGRRAAVQLGALPENIIQFPWGIDLSAFPAQSPRAPNGELTVISARSMEPMYDVATTIEAFARMTTRRPDLNARLVVVGSGTLESELRRLAVARGVDSQIDWKGRLTEVELQHVLAESTVYASSSMVDGSSITLLQAMATGLPSVVSDVGGNREWIRHRETGLLFAPGDSEEFAACLEESLDSAGLRASLGRAARTDVERRGDWRVHQIKLIRECHALSGST